MSFGGAGRMDVFRGVVWCFVFGTSIFALANHTKSEPVGDTYLICKGSVTIFLPKGSQTDKNEEIAAHVTEDRINFSGIVELEGTDIQICRYNMDEFYFDSQTCQEGGPVDLSRRREHGTMNKITGKLHLSIEAPQLFLEQGAFICKKTKPLMK